MLKKIMLADGSGVEVDTEKKLWGFMAGDEIMLVPDEKIYLMTHADKEERTITVVGVDPNGKALWLDIDGQKGPISVNVPKGIYLKKRSGWEFKMGDRVIAKNSVPKGKSGEIIVLDPNEKLLRRYLVSYPSLTKGINGITDMDEGPWFPDVFRDESRNRWWHCEEDLELLSGGEEKVVKNEGQDKKAKAEAAAAAEKPALAWPEITKETPEWLAKIIIQAEAGNANLFIVWGNVGDLISSGNKKLVRLEEYLTGVFPDRESVISYSISGGLRFANAKMENDFRIRYFGGDETTGEEMGEEASKPASQPKALSDLMGGKSPEVVLPALEHFMRAKTATGKVVILEYGHNIVPNEKGSKNYADRVASETLLRWAENEEMRKAGHIIFLVCPNLFAVDASLRASDSGACIVRIPKPDEKARQERWQYWVKEQGIKHDEGCDETVLGRITNGLSIRQIDEICQAAQVRGQLLSLSLIKTKKQEILNNEIGDKVKITIPTQGFDALGGKDELKAYLMEIKGNILSGNSRRVPVGLLASGPPGTSKTYTFQCWAYECDVVFVEIQNPRDMYVGQSEERMLEIFAILEDLAPVIVVEDEADQSESSRGSYSGDSGVSNRLRQMKFTFCSDPKHRGKIIWVRISNRDDLLDAAYKRKGRTDDKIPFLLPEEEDYKAIFAVMFRRDKISTDITDFSALSKKVAAKTYCTGADIEWMVGEADKYAGREGAEKVTEKHLDQAIDDWEMDMNPRDVDRQIVLAIKGSSKRLRPKNWEQMLAAVNKRMDGTA